MISISSAETKMPHHHLHAAFEYDWMTTGFESLDLTSSDAEIDASILAVSNLVTEPVDGYLAFDHDGSIYVVQYDESAESLVVLGDIPRPDRTVNQLF